MQSRSETTIDQYDRYMITISCQQKLDYISKDSIDEVISWLKLSIPSLDVLLYVYENSGKYRQLHWHALVLVRYKFRYKPYTTFGAKHITGNTYIIRWDVVTFLVGALLYLKKDLRYKSQDEILIDNYYSINRFSESYLN